MCHDNCRATSAFTDRLGHDLLQFRRVHRLGKVTDSAPRPPLSLFPPARSVRLSRNSRSNPAAVSLVCESPRWNRHRRAEGDSSNYTICTFLSSADTHCGALAVVCVRQRSQNSAGPTDWNVCVPESGRRPHLADSRRYPSSVKVHL